MVSTRFARRFFGRIPLEILSNTGEDAGSEGEESLTSHDDAERNDHAPPMADLTEADMSQWAWGQLMK